MLHVVAVVAAAPLTCGVNLEVLHVRVRSQPTITNGAVGAYIHTSHFQHFLNDKQQRPTKKNTANVTFLGFEEGKVPDFAVAAIPSSKSRISIHSIAG